MNWLMHLSREDSRGELTLMARCACVTGCSASLTLSKHAELPMYCPGKSKASGERRRAVGESSALSLDLASRSVPAKSGTIALSVCSSMSTSAACTSATVCQTARMYCSSFWLQKCQLRVCAMGLYDHEERSSSQMQKQKGCSSTNLVIETSIAFS
jgi:hypothetical protein